MRLMITGAAPVSPTVLTFLRAALGCQVKYYSDYTIFLMIKQRVYLFYISMLFSVRQFYEGYGQTECTAGCSMSLPGDWTAGNTLPPPPQTHTHTTAV